MYEMAFCLGIPFIDEWEEGGLREAKIRYDMIMKGWMIKSSNLW